MKQEASVIDLAAFFDVRGSFVKTFNDTLFQSLGIPFTLKESYFSVSAKDVIRGMHFQLPPHQHAKIVYCPFGAILDVALDLRLQSPTYVTRETCACITRVSVGFLSAGRRKQRAADERHPP